MVIEFTAPDECDIYQLVHNMNPADKRELLAIGVNPSWGVRHSIEVSPHAMAVRVDGLAACILGLAIEDGLGLYPPKPWLFGTALLFVNPRVFVKSTRKVLDLWLSEFPEISNYVDERHTSAVQWLRHFGAEISAPEPYGPFARPFHKFTFRRS